MFNPSALTVEAPKLQKFALRLTRSKHDADDLVQATMLRALEKNALFEDGTDLFKWTARMMFNLFVSQYRRKTKFESQYDPENHINNQSVEANQEKVMDLKIVNTAMGRLSHEHRQILVMVCIQGLQYEEAAAELGMPVGTVRSRLNRARNALQQELQAVTTSAGLARGYKAAPASLQVSQSMAYTRKLGRAPVMAA